jgi:hypothetical protein
MEFLRRGLAESAKDSGVGWMAYNPLGIGVGYVAQKIDLKYRYLFASSFNIVFGIFGEFVSKI